MGTILSSASPVVCLNPVGAACARFGCVVLSFVGKGCATCRSPILGSLPYKFRGLRELRP